MNNKQTTSQNQPKRDQKVIATVLEAKIPLQLFSVAFFGLKASSDTHFDPRKLCYESSSLFSYYTVNYVIQPEVLLNSH